MVAFSVVISFLNTPKNEPKLEIETHPKGVETGSIKQLVRPSIPVHPPAYMKIQRKEAVKINSDAQHIINELKTLVEDLKQAQSGSPPHKID
jgi:hypothetical protein